MLFLSIILISLILGGLGSFLSLRKRLSPVPSIVASAIAMLLGMTTTYFIREGQLLVPEMLHYQYIKMTYFEDWNEYIHKTCSRESCSGSGDSRTCTTDYYDCSYVDYNPEYWEAETNAGTTKYISKTEYNEAVKLWGNQTFIDMRRPYYTNDGDAYTTKIPDSAVSNPYSNKILGYTTKGSYRNKIVSSKSVFKFKEVSHEEDSIYGLHKWNSSPLLGVNDPVAMRYLNNANYINGFTSQLSMRIMVYTNQPLQAGFLQESSWNGGNKNEFNVCIGTDKDSNITWTKVFSWTKNEKLKLEVRDSIYDMKKLNMQEISKYVVDYVPKRFIRREFKEFEYLPTPESPWLYVIGFVMNLVAFVAGIIISIKNNTKIRYGRFR